MEIYPRAAVERAMKIQEVILRAVAKKITWRQAGEIIGLANDRCGGGKSAMKSSATTGFSIIVWESRVRGACPLTIVKRRRCSSARARYRRHAP
jgi:hypothetical protein